MKVLVTGFDPFDQEKINPAYEAVKKLPNEIAGARLVKREIPTVFNKSFTLLQEIIAAERPDITICIGQAGGRYKISVERVAINVDDARIPDNEDQQPIDKKIVVNGPAAYFANLPIKKMTAAMQAEKIPSQVSNTAGTFVCNHIMYSLLHLINEKYPKMQGGFIHVPFIPEQVLDKKAQASMSLKDITRGLQFAIAEAVNDFKA